LRGRSSQKKRAIARADGAFSRRRTPSPCKYSIACMYRKGACMCTNYRISNLKQKVCTCTPSQLAMDRCDFILRRAHERKNYQKKKILICHVRRVGWIEPRKGYSYVQKISICFFFKNFTDQLIIINMCFKTILFLKRKQKNYKMIKTRNLIDVESNRYIDRRRRGPL
jgi:hypothetical protein